MSRHDRTPRAGSDRANLYDEITDKIIAELEAGRFPWVQPWGKATAKAPLGLPRNASTGRSYSGINILILWGAVVQHGFPGQGWLNFRQAQSLGGNVRKGERGTTIVYADRFTPEDEKRRARETGEEPGSIPFLKRFTVFNAAQCEGLLHRLVTDCFLPHSTKGCLEAHVREVHFPAQAEDLGESVSAKSIQDRHERWGDHIPADDAALWDWLTDQDDDTRMELLAHCISFGVNALHEKPNPYGGMGVSQHGLDVRLSQADRLARATGLDMVAVGWRPTVANYLGRVTKPRIIEAVREGAGERAAQLIDHLKKGDMAKKAERLLAETAWLPEPLRMIDPDADADADAEADIAVDGGADAVDLPDFLSGDGDEDETAEEEGAQSMVAAE